MIRIDAVDAILVTASGPDTRLADGGPHDASTPRPAADPGRQRRSCTVSAGRAAPALLYATISTPATRGQRWRDQHDQSPSSLTRSAILSSPSVGTARYEPSIIPEAIHHPWGLSLSGSWSALYGPHLTYPASEDIPAHGHGGPTTASDRKAALRRGLRARRRAYVDGLDAAALDAAQAALAARVVDRLDPATVVAGYVAVAAEVDPAAILIAAAARGLATALPHVESRVAPLRFLRWSPGDPLVAGPFGLLQPVDDAPSVDPDLILAPLVGFDRALGRLGQGAAHYDRAFAAWPAARRIGLAWAVQENGPLPVEPWDMALHAIATETEWIAP